MADPSTSHNHHQKSPHVTRLTHPLPAMRYIHSLLPLLLLLLLFLPAQCSPRVTELSRPSSHPAPMDMAQWMSYLPDGTCLSTLSIPGTHDTMASSAAAASTIAKFAQTQSGTLTQQLDAGVRFLDIRARHYRDAFEMHHGAAYLGRNFTSVVRTLDRFLAGPGKAEVLLVRLRDEQYRPKHNGRTFAQTLEHYVFAHPDTSAILQRRLHIPPQQQHHRRRRRRQTLYKFPPRLGSETRGRIVLIQDYSTEGATTTFGAGFTDPTRVRVQDYYSVATTADVVVRKWSEIVQFWVRNLPEQARRIAAGDDCQDLPLLVNFLSAASVFQTPAAVALHRVRGINNRVQLLLRKRWQTAWDPAFPSFQWGIPELRGPTTGIVVWDFINTRAARLVVSFNFRGDRRFDWSEVGYASRENKWSYRPWN